jgi:hypothetical protein
MVDRKPFENGSNRAASAKMRFCAASVAGSSPQSLGLRVGTAYRRRSGAGIWEMSGQYPLGRGDGNRGEPGEAFLDNRTELEGGRHTDPVAPIFSERGYHCSAINVSLELEQCLHGRCGQNRCQQQTALFSRNGRHVMTRQHFMTAADNSSGSG